MNYSRLNLSQEKILWEIALAYFGPVRLHQVLLELWPDVEAPARALVEYLDIGTVGAVVLSILKVVQAALGATAPRREEDPNRIALYSRHAQSLTDGLLTLIPAKQLPRALRGFKLQLATGL